MAGGWSCAGFFGVMDFRWRVKDEDKGKGEGKGIGFSFSLPIKQDQGDDIAFSFSALLGARACVAAKVDGGRSLSRIR